MPSSRRPAAPGASARPGGRTGSRASTSRSGSSTRSTSRPTSGTSGKGTGAAKSTGSGKRPGTSRPPATSAGASKAGASKTGSSKAGGAKGASRSRGTRSAVRSGSGQGSRPRTQRAPALEDRRRSRYGILLPEVLTVRMLVLSVVVLLAVVLLLPTVRAYVNQTGELRQLRSDLQAAEQQRDALQVELDRWSDTSYVITQARDRYSFVMPGETVWRVIDPESVVEEIDPQTGQAVTDGPVVSGFGEETPWYAAIWRSVEIAGEHDGGTGTEVGEPVEDEPASGSGDNG